MTKIKWHYTGDVSLEHGGTFIDFSEWKHGYVNVVEVTDLDSGCGFRGASLIEERSITIDDRSRWSAALSTIGASLINNDDICDNDSEPYKRDSFAWRMCLVYALNAYGAYDIDWEEVDMCDDTEEDDASEA